MKMREWTFVIITSALLVACGESRETTTGSSGGTNTTTGSHAGTTTTTSGAGPKLTIVDSEIGVFAKDLPEEPGYGRYTYVLLPRAQSNRAFEFLNDLFQSASFQGGTGLAKMRLNLFEVPVKPTKAIRFYMSTADGSALGRMAIDAYNFDRAAAILDVACAQSDPRYARICSSSRTVGPYLLSYAHPVEQKNSITMPYLVVDLSGVDTKAFPYFIARMMEQVQDPNITSSARIYSFKGFLLSWLLQFNMVAPQLKQQIVQLVPKATGS